MARTDIPRRLRDYLWGAMAVALAALLATGVVLGVVDLVIERTAAAVVDLAVGAAFTAVVGRWLVMGAWRRTAWGAPPGGLRELAWRRGSLRHRA